MTGERWLPVPGWEALYEVSDLGQVRSMDRITVRSDGKAQPFRGRVLRLLTRSLVYKAVFLHDRERIEQRSVHHLVLEAFVGPRPSGMEARHLNDDPSDNRLVNLAYGT